jgi:hypothetical protein
VKNIIRGNVTTLGVIAVLGMVDETPPTTELTLGNHYVDEAGRIYVTSKTAFTLLATDAFSGVANTSYRINHQAMVEYTRAFTLDGSEGTFLIEYYSVDVAGNIEPIKVLTVYLFNFHVFRDTSNRETLLKLNTTLQLFQLSAPDTDFGIRKVDSMRVYESAFIRVITIFHRDAELSLLAIIVQRHDGDLCLIFTWDRPIVYRQSLLNSKTNL